MPKELYGEEGMNLKPKKKLVKPPAVDANGELLPGLHEGAFKPGGCKYRSNKNVDPTIGKFPEYLPNPPKPVKR